jgi:hypothetical protein
VNSNDECYHCEHFASEHDADGDCRCIVVWTWGDEKCRCPGYKPDEPPHIAYEWSQLNSGERRDLVEWCYDRGGSV